MRKIKRALALVLCVAMVVSAAMVGVPVGAEVSTNDTLANVALSVVEKTRSELGIPNKPWCCYFVGYCINNSCISSIFDDKMSWDQCANSITLISWVCGNKDAGTYYSLSSTHTNRLNEEEYASFRKSVVPENVANFTPNVGDIVVFDWAGREDVKQAFNHAAIVTAFDGNYITYVDGNSDGRGSTTVLSHTESKNLKSIIGYLRIKDEFCGKKEYTSDLFIERMTYNNHIYAIYNYATSWNNAKEKCESFGGHLATVTSAEEQAVVAQLAAKAGKTVWLGATRGSGDSYSWVTGESIGYRNWAANEPNNYGGIENCAAMYAVGTWNDLAPDSGSAKGFICEWEGYVTDASELEGEFYIVSALDTNKAIDIVEQSQSKKAYVHLWDFHGGDSQIFKVSHVGNEIILTNKNSGKTLDVKWGGKSSGTPIWQWDTNKNKSQRFTPEYVGDGYFMLKSALGHYLDATGGYSNNGTKLQVYSKNDTAAQKWRFVYVDQSQNRGCDHIWENETETAHPHRQLKKCSKCGVTEYTSDGSYVSNCSECNPTCSHSWKTDTESAHPHRQYKKCTKCGEKEYTSDGSYVSTCSECNPECSHSWSYGCEYSHPHRDFKMCQKCGEKVYINDGTYDSSCAKCNPSCNHAWTTRNDDAHPHNEYRVCTKCGEKSYTGKTGYSSSCATCTYTPSWGSWSDWSTSSVSESSTRQVETKTQYVYYHYHLTYDDNNVGNYPINMATANENFKNLANAHVKAEAYHEYYSDSPLTLCSGRLVYLVNGKSVVWDKYVNKCSEDTGSYDGNANFLYYKGTRTLYRYRDYK